MVNENIKASYDVEAEYKRCAEIARKKRIQREEREKKQCDCPVFGFNRKGYCRNCGRKAELI